MDCASTHCGTLIPWPLNYLRPRYVFIDHIVNLRSPEILSFTSDLARKAGDLIIQGSQAIASLGSGDGIDEKKNSVDLVTEYDVRVEELVKKRVVRRSVYEQIKDQLAAN